MVGPRPGSAELPRAARRALKRRRSRAGALPRLHFDHAAPRSARRARRRSAQSPPGGGAAWSWRRVSSDTRPAGSSSWRRAAAARPARAHGRRRATRCTPRPSGRQCPSIWWDPPPAPPARAASTRRHPASDALPPAVTSWAGRPASSVLCQAHVPSHAAASQAALAHCPASHGRGPRVSLSPRVRRRRHGLAGMPSCLGACATLFANSGEGGKMRGVETEYTLVGVSDPGVAVLRSIRVV